MEFKGKTVLVTGASRSLGRQIAYDFAKEGAKVIINYNNSYEDAKKLKEEIDRSFEESIMIKCDISKEEEVKSMLSLLEEKNIKIDILVNNAGIAIDNILDLKDANEFKKVIDTNLLGTFLVTKYISKIMNKSGSIINISSDNAFYGYEESIDYDASKAGVISLTKNFAKSLKPIRVNCICPGWINTDMNKELTGEQIKNEENKIILERFAEKEEISNVVLFLASDKASYVNSSVLVVNGGKND